MNTTHPVGATTHHTEQTLKARYREALAIFEAWSDRVRSSGGQDRVAAELQRDDAWAWVERTKQDLEAFRSVARQQAAAPGWAHPRGRSGVGWAREPLLGPQKRTQLAPAASTIRPSRRRRTL